MKTINPGRESYPVAHVNIEVAGYKTDLEVCVHSDLSYDVLLGRNFPYLWEVGFCEVNVAVCHMVKTRQQQRKEIEENQTDIAKAEIESEVFSYINSSENEMESDCTSNAVDSSLESNSEMEEDDNVNTHITMDSSDYHVCENLPLLSSIVPEKAEKVLKSKFKRSEKRASKQVHAALEALPKELDHNGDNMSEEQRKDPSLKLLWQKVEYKDKEYQNEQGLL